jgi:hypothetical protein
MQPDGVYAARTFLSHRGFDELHTHVGARAEDVGSEHRRGAVKSAKALLEK